MGKAIGIDLGTTNTAVAVLVDGRPRVLEDDKGYKVLPSCVSLKADDSFVVGQSARNLILTRPNRTVFAIKRLMGRRYDTPEVEQVRKLVGYEIAAAEDGTCKIRLGDSWFTPVDLSAEILKVAKSLAERNLGEPVTEAVITVPAYFNHAQRAATFQAAELAGLRCERIINEPTAAALAYGYRKDIEKSIVVYDLGGGTFDVSVLRLSHGIYEVLSTSGDTHLGGEDFDHRIVDHLSEEFQAGTGVDLRIDPTALQRLKDAAERAKCELSFTDRTTVLIPRITMADNLEQTLTRLKLEELVERLVQRSLEITRKAITDAGLRISDVDDVILVGGQTRMPRVREAIAALFQREPSRGVHPEEVVAIGAAVQANSLVSDEPTAEHTLLLDVTPFTLGIDVVGGLFQPIITRNSQVPASSSQTFSTARDNQRAVRVTVRQGEDQVASQNEFLGEFVMNGLTPAARMETKVEVTFRLDVNGMLHVTALEQGTGERKRITIRNYAEYVKSDGDVRADLEGDVGGEVEDLVKAEAEAAAQSDGGGGFLRRIFGRKSSGGRATKSSSTVEAPAVPDAVEAPTVEMDTVDTVPEMPDFLRDLEASELEAMPEESALGGLEPVGGLEELDALEPLDLPPPQPSLDLGASPDAPDLPEPLTAQDLGEFASDYEDELDDLDDGFAELDAGQDYAVEDGGFDAPESAEPSDVGFAMLDGGDLAPLDDGDLPVPEDSGTFAPVGDDPWAGGPDETEEMPVEFDGDDLGRAAPTLEISFDSLDALDQPTELSIDRMGLQALSQPPVVDDAEVPSEDEETVVFRTEPMVPTRREPDWRTADDLPHEDPFADAEDAFDGDDGPVATAIDELPTGELDTVSPDEPTAVGRAPVVGPGASAGPRPARLRLAYRRVDALVTECRENLRKGGCFVQTTSPLKEGRQCVIEVRAPGLLAPLELEGVVTWSSAGRGTLASDQTAGMGIEYRLSVERQAEVEAALVGVVG